MAGLTICVNIQGGQIAEVAIPKGGCVPPCAGRIIVTAGGQSRDRFTALFSRATIRILMDMEPVQARGEIF